MRDDAWPAPEPGDVLSYSYLWAREAKAGQKEGLKDRPVVVVLATQTSGETTEVMVTPITHSAPDEQEPAIEVPANVKRDLGLDRLRSWVVTGEVNRFRWPGPDIRMVDAGTPYFGAIPDWLFREVQQSISAEARRGRVQITKRTE